MNMRTETKDGPYFMRVLVVLAAVALSSLVSSAGNAEAAFPGKIGKIVFSSDRTTGVGVSNPEGDAEIFAMGADGTSPKQLTRNASDDTDPAVSANGRQIAFATDRDGNEEIYKMNPDGTGQINLSRNPAPEERAPDWQPIR